MSKYVKGLLVNDISRKLDGVRDALLVDVIGLDSNKAYGLRKELREKGLKLLVVHNGVARRATQGTALAPAFEGARGSLALMWGAEDFISLAKEFVSLNKSGKYEKLEARGGVMDGEAVASDRVAEISKWPNRQQQLGILMGQILSPGAKLQSQLLGPGGRLASQIEKKSEGGEPAEGGDAAPDGGAPAAAAEAPSA